MNSRRFGDSIAGEGERLPELVNIASVSAACSRRSTAQHGVFTALDAICTHINCTVAGNALDLTLDGRQVAVRMPIPHRASR